MVRRSAAAILLLASACKGDGAASSPGDGGTGGDVDDGSEAPTDDSGGSGTAEATSADASDTEGSGEGPTTPLQQYCEIASAHLEVCGDTLGQCDRAKLAECPEVFAVEREEVLTARAACGFPETCSSLTDYAHNSCMYEVRRTLEPTAIQRALAADLCAACFPDDDACLETTWFVGAPLENGWEVSGTATSFLDYTDEFVEQLTAQCAPAADESCVQIFLFCIEDQLAEIWPSSVASPCL